MSRMSNPQLLKREQEESLREAAALGNEDALEALIHNGVAVNAQNAINGWTPLHWACKRGHRSIVQRLLHHGADVNLMTAKGESCLQMTENLSIVEMLGGNPENVMDQSTPLPIVPNYISNPPFPYNDSITKQLQSSTPSLRTSPTKLNSSAAHSDLPKVPPSEHDGSDLVIKVRVAGCDDPDFIEIDLPRSSTFDQLVALVCSELRLAPGSNVRKLRKLPNTIVRNDRDVRRLVNYNELEIVLGPMQETTSSAATKHINAYTAAVTPKKIDVFY